MPSNALDLDAADALANAAIDMNAQLSRVYGHVHSHAFDEIERVLVSVGSLTHALRAAQQDAQRLDWLERQRDGVHAEVSKLGTINNVHSAATVYTFMNEYRADNLRDAIDAAIDAERAG